ncbi:MAG: EAL domain-containing protein [Acidobacteria bacterium]|nr:EAL domain-containing protein [Acidobacteriota bacterium]
MPLCADEGYSVPEFTRATWRSPAGCTLATTATERRSRRNGIMQTLACSSQDEAFGGRVCPWRYTVVGVVVGLFFPALAWMLELGLPSRWSPEAVWAMHRSNPLHWIIDTAPLVLAAFATPIGIWRRRQRVAQYEHDFLETVLGTVDGVILLFDGAGQIWHANLASDRILGLAPEAICGRPVWDVVFADEAATVRERCESDANDGFPYHFESVCDLPGGSRRRLAWSITPVPVGNRRVRLFLATGIDVTERHLLHERLSYQAFHDPLTGLANRTLFQEQVRLALERDPRRVCVLFIDLDGFKAVNDRHGHAVGDALLKAASRQLLNATRGIDTVARLGGDEFAVLLERVSAIEDASVVARRVLGALSEPLAVADIEVQISASIGLALSQGDPSADALLCQADTAMYHAKRTGKGRWVVFDPEAHAGATDRLCLEADLRLAVERHELVVHYQPIVDLDTGATVIVEALVRWMHPERGLLGPDEFIGIAEETGLIVPLGRQVLREACRQVLTWQGERAVVDEPLALSVNVSSHQLRHDSFLADLEAVLQEEGFDARHLMLEITEGILMQDRQGLAEWLARIRHLGVRIALDDFGTGYSSLSYLQRFPVDLLKLDREFVAQLGSNRRSGEVTRGVLSLAEALGLETVAEGVEHPRQVEALRRLGCHYGQGFHFAPPRTAAEFTRRSSELASVGSASRS